MSKGFSAKNAQTDTTQEEQQQEDFQFAVALLLEEEREFNRTKSREHGYNPYAVY
jgi:hypothetical protein